MKITAAILALACASSAFGAKIVIVKPRARVVVVVRPRFSGLRFNGPRGYDAAGFAGGVIGSAISQWMINRQNRAVYGNCNALFDSNCHPPVATMFIAPVAVPVAVDPGVCTGNGCSYTPGQLSAPWPADLVRQADAPPVNLPAETTTNAAPDPVIHASFSK